MDKEKYVEGLFAFYELNRIDLLKSAYIQGYVDSASRYDAYVGRERSALVERVGEIIAALNDASHIAYGISKKMFGDYQRLPAPRRTQKARSRVL